MSTLLHLGYIHMLYLEDQNILPSGLSQVRIWQQLKNKPWVMEKEARTCTSEMLNLG